MSDTSKNVKIFFIYADDCDHCMDALNTIRVAIKKCPEISCHILKFHYNSPVALNIAIEQGIDDLPSFVIGNVVFQGSDYSLKRIEDAIRQDC